MDDLERQQEDPSVIQDATLSSGEEVEPSPTRKEMKERPILSTADALLAIERGELIQNVQIHRLHLRGNFAKPIRFRNVVLGDLVFDRAKCTKIVSFEGCLLERPRFSPGTEFAEGLSFKGGEVKGAQFRDVTIKGSFKAQRVQFVSRFQALDVHLAGKAQFFDARFRAWVQWERCEFEDEADFRSITVEEGLVFTGCRFLGDARFRGASVQKKFDLSESRFERMLDLSKAKLNDYVYMETITQGERMRFGFENAVAERLLIRPDQLEGRIASELDGHYINASHEYGLLKRNFSGLHRYEGEDWAFYKFKVCQRMGMPRTWKKPWKMVTRFFDWLMLDLGCGYGTNPWRAVRAALVIMLFFGLVFMAGTENLNVEKAPLAGQPVESAGNRVLIGLLTSVSVFTAGFTNIRDLAQGWVNIPLVVESLLGTLLWGLFIVAFSRKVIR